MGKTPYTVPLSVRKTVLRTIIISNILCLVINVVFVSELLFASYLDMIIFRMTGSVFLGLTIASISVSLHHTLRLWPREIWSVRSDLIYSTAECIFVTGYVITEITLLWVTELELPAFATVVPIFVIFWLSTGFSLVFMIWDLHVARYQTIVSTYDFTENHEDLRKSEIGRWSLLLGANTFKKRFGVDRMFVRIPRGVISILPMLLDGYIHTSVFDYDDNDSIAGNVTMRVVPIFEIFENFSESETLPSGLFDVDIKWEPESQHATCQRIDGNYQVDCRVLSPLAYDSPKILTIAIDYTQALKQYPRLSLKTGVYLVFDTGAPADNQTDYEIIEYTVTPPMQLYPGFHLFGTTFYSSRRIWANTWDFIVGIPKFQNLLIANVQALIRDDESVNSDSDDTTATLRLTYNGASYATQGLILSHDDKADSSIINGFGLLGGFWTFINGTFAAVFGCNILLVLCGIKPLSIYGLVHCFQRRVTLVDGAYTLSAEEQERTVAVLREHLFNDGYGDLQASDFSERQGQDEEKSKLCATIQ